MDRAIADLALSQYGVVATRQLCELGLSPPAIARRTAAGRLHPVHRGVYAVGHSCLALHGRWMAAVLTSGPAALLSHRSAACLWGLRVPSGATIEVTVGEGFRRNRPGLLLHRSRNLERDDAANAQRIPTTAVSRTLLDLADVVGARHLRRAFEDAERLRLIDLTSLREVRARSPGRRGLRVFDAVLAEIDVPPDTRSELERLFFELCRENGLPLPETNAVVAGFEVDALWSQHRLIVELDGYAYHRTRAAFERDRKRDAALQLAGYRVLWITFRRLLEEPELVAEEIRRLLAQGA